jgi:hypothetical protein
MIEVFQETEVLARRVADARHLTVDAAAREALEVSANAAGIPVVVARDAFAESVAARREHAARFVEELAAMLILNDRPLQ